MSPAPSPRRIRIHLEYAAVLELSGLPNGAHLDLPPGSTVADLLRRGGMREAHLGTVIPVVNGTRRRLEAPLEDGDRVSLRLPLGGG